MHTAMTESRGCYNDCSCRYCELFYNRLVCLAMGDNSHCDKEIQCITHWFSGWRQHEKSEFLKVLLDKAVPSNVDTLFEAMNHVTVSDRPPSIFQCQIKLFNQWYNDWTPHHRHMLYANLTQDDPDFMTKLNEAIFQQSIRIS